MNVAITLTQAKRIADHPAGHTLEELTAALRRLEEAKRHSQHSERASIRAAWRIENLSAEIARCR